MTRRILIGLVPLIIASFPATSAFAEVSYPCGLYFEINYGASQANGKDYPDNYEVEDNGGPGWNVNAGYKFFPFFAVDLGYTRYDDTELEIETDDDEGSEIDADDHHYSINLALKGIYPFMNTGLELFGKVGVSWMYSEVETDGSSSDDDDDDDDDGNSETATGLYVGAGIDYVVAHELSFNIQWMRAYGGDEVGTLDLLSAGVNILWG